MPPGRRRGSCRWRPSRTSSTSCDAEAALLRRYGWEAEVLDRDGAAGRGGLPDLPRRRAPAHRRGARGPGRAGARAAADGARASACGCTSAPRCWTPACARRAGSVRADRVLLATGAYPPLTRSIRRLVAPVYDYALVTEPLSAAQRARDRLGARAGHRRPRQPLPLLPAHARRPDPVRRLRGRLPVRQPRRRPAAEPPPAGAPRCSPSTCSRRSRRSRGSASRTPGAARSTRAAASA